MQRFLLCLGIFFGSVPSSAKSMSWEIDQTMKVLHEGEDAKEYAVKYLLTSQKLWRSVKPKDAKDESETTYAIFDSVRFYNCQVMNSKKTCSVVTESPFDPILLWAHTYGLDFKIGKVGLRRDDNPKVVLDHSTKCFRSLLGGKVRGSSTNVYRVIKTSSICYSTQIEFEALGKRMVSKMKSIKSYMDGENLKKYEKLTTLGIPLTQTLIINSAGVGPFGIGKTQITVSTESISNKRLDVARQKLPEGFEVVDMTDQLKDVSFTPGKQ